VDEVALTKIAHKQIAVFEALRRCGYPPADIYVAVVDGKGQVSRHGSVKTVLRTQGKQFVIDIEADSKLVKVDRGEYHRVWEAEAARWNSKGTAEGAMVDEERDRIYRDNVTEGWFLDLVVLLRKKGLRVPNLPAAQRLSL
jgi:ribosomal protein L25 (general stress protein Ctc)